MSELVMKKLNYWRRIVDVKKNPGGEDGKLLKQMKHDNYIYYECNLSGYMNGRIWGEFFEHIILPYVNEHVEQEKYVLVMFDYAPVHNDLSFRDKWTEK